MAGPAWITASGASNFAGSGFGAAWAAPANSVATASEVDSRQTVFSVMTLPTACTPGFSIRFGSLGIVGRQHRRRAGAFRGHHEGWHSGKLPRHRYPPVLSRLGIGVRVGQMLQGVIKAGNIDALELLETHSSLSHREEDLYP